MHICWTLFIALWLLLGGFGLYIVHLISDFTAAVIPAIYVVFSAILPALIVGPFWLRTAGARIRHWRLWNPLARSIEVEVDPALQSLEQRLDENTAYAYLVEYDTPSWESDIPLEALFAFTLPGTRDLHLRELPTVFAPNSLLQEPVLGWLLPYVGVQAAPPPLTLMNAFRDLRTKDVVLLNPSDPQMPIDGFVNYDSYFFETLAKYGYQIVPVRIHTPRRFEHTYGLYGTIIPAMACLFGIAPASLPHLLWTWLRQPRRPRTRITMGAPLEADATNYRAFREALKSTGTKTEEEKEKEA